MAKPLVSDELWAVVAPQLPPPRRDKLKSGRPRVPDRAALAGILFVLKTGIPWEYLPQEMGCGSGTCWRRLRDWHQAGVWHRLHTTLLDRLGEADQIDWSRASIDTASVPAKGGAPRPPQPPRRSARIRRIAANRARSATLWSIGPASRSPSGSVRPTSTMAR